MELMYLEVKMLKIQEGKPGVFKKKKKQNCIKFEAISLCHSRRLVDQDTQL